MLLTRFCSVVRIRIRAMGQRFTPLAPAGVASALSGQRNKIFPGFSRLPAGLRFDLVQIARAPALPSREQEPGPCCPQDVVKGVAGWRDTQSNLQPLELRFPEYPVAFRTVLKTALPVTPILKETVPVKLSSLYNVIRIYTDGSKFNPSDRRLCTFSAGAPLGYEPTGANVVFKLGPSKPPDAVTRTIDLPRGRFLRPQDSCRRVGRQSGESDFYASLRRGHNYFIRSEPHQRRAPAVFQASRSPFAHRTGSSPMARKMGTHSMSSLTRFPWTATRSGARHSLRIATF
jgi:hypothetical protein